MTEDLTVYHDEDFVVAILVGGPNDGTRVRINVQNGLRMSEGRAILPPEITVEGGAPGAGYRVWTVMDGNARYRWYETAVERGESI